MEAHLHPTFEQVSAEHSPEAPAVPRGDDGEVDFESSLRTTRQRRSSSHSQPSRARQTSKVLQEALEETQICGLHLSRQLNRKARSLWREVAQPLWLPLLGLATLGSAFTVPLWLAILDILVGAILIHLRCWQDWIRITCAWSGRTIRLVMVERAFGIAAVVLGCVALLYRVAFSAAGHFAAFDLAFIIFSLGGAASAWCKPLTNPKPHVREVPSLPLLLLFLAISTLAPVPGLASVPYVLLFLALLVLLVWRSGLGSFSFTTRLCLLFMTTTHLIALLTLSFWGPGAPQTFVAVFGRVGRVLTLNHGLPLCSASITSTDDPLGACGKGGSTDVFWPGVHVTCLLMLHFVLTNVSSSSPWASDNRENSSRRTPPPELPELTTRDGAGAKVWTKLAVRWGVFANLVLMVVWFPCLMTMPLLLMSFSLTVEKEGLLRSICPGIVARCLGKLLRGLGRLVCCRCRKQKQVPDFGADDEVADWKGRYVCFYMAAIFLIKYLFNILREELPGKPGVYGWLNERLRLQDAVPVAKARRSWLQVIGLQYYGGVAEAAGNFFPQALILTIAVSLEAVLAHPEIPRHRWTQYSGQFLERLWSLACRVNYPEVSMVAVLILSSFVIECEEGRASVFMVSYIVVLVCIMLCRKMMRARLWLLLQCLAELGSVVLMLVYVVTAPRMELPYPFNNIITVKCRQLPAIVAPHLGIALVAGLQRLCQRHFEAPLGRTRTSTVESQASDATTAEEPLSTERRLDKAKDYLVMFLDKTALRRLKLFLEEMIVLSVMILSLVTTLLPPVDVHSLLLLAVVGPALLIYNLEDDRERLLLKVNLLLQILSAIFLLSRVVTASPLVPLPSDKGWHLSLEELGIHRPLTQSTKMVFLGLVTVLTRVAMKEAKAAIQEIDQLEKLTAAEAAEAAESSALGSADTFPGSAAPSVAPPAGEPVAGAGGDGALGEAAPEARRSVTFDMTDSHIEDIHASTHTDFMASHVPNGDGLSMDDGDEMVRPTHRPGFFGGVGGGQQRPSSRMLKMSRSESSMNLKRKLRRDRRRSGGPRWEEKLLMKWVPGWMPHQPHAYLSALLLVVSFAVSITEVHVLNFLMILAVISLCGWYELWVHAGNVFSVTTVLIMLLQYVARFRVRDDIINDAWVKVIGLQWSSNQVVRHSWILVLCLLQKQLWHRGRYSKPRPPVCPRWLSRHADLVGMAALLLVAVARRHFLSPLLAFATLPFIVREEWEDLKSFSVFFHPGQRMTRSWLRFFRLVLLLTLLGQVCMRLVVEFEMEDHLDVFYSWSCTIWEADATAAPRPGGEPHPAKAVARAECVQAWRNYLVMVDNVGAKLLWEFLALFFLGVVQQLFERVEDEEEHSSVMKAWKLKAMHWWSCMVYIVTFVLSLEGGSVLGIVFLVLLLGIALSTTKPLARRRRWIWRTQLVAWIFLFIGLCVQSPMLPCTRASCDGQVHRTFVPHDRCVILQDLNITEVETETSTDKCGSGANALGHDTFLTLTMQVVGLRRIGGDNFWQSLGVLLGSQLGVLLSVIIVASIQIRIFNSAAYRQQVDEQFIAEPEALYIERARRYVHEFYCRRRVEELAARERRKALRDKLKRVMRKINEILSGRLPIMGSVMEEARHDILVEELQLSHGVKKETASEVTEMFEQDMSLSKEYLDVLHLVTLGRLQPDGDRLQRQFERLQSYLGRERIQNASAKAVQTAKQVMKLSSLRSSESDLPSFDLHPMSQASGPMRRRANAQWRHLLSRGKILWRRFLVRWEQVKEGRTVARCMYDYAFMGTDETSFCLRSPFEVAHEELDEHRRGNGPFRLLWKMALSNMASVVAVASVLAFVETRSILDLLRTFVVFFVAVQQYPFPKKEFWTGLLAFNVFLLVFRTIYDLPIFCAGPSLRAFNGGSSWEPQNTLLWCPAVTTISFDITFGFAKRRGASAIGQSTWFWATWADHLCIWSVLLHQWMLMRSGLWDHIVYDNENQQVWLSTHGRLQVSGGSRGGSQSSNNSENRPLERVFRTSRLKKSPTKGPGEIGLERRHRSLVTTQASKRDGFVNKYYEMMSKESARLAAIQAAKRASQEMENAANAPSSSEAVDSSPVSALDSVSDSEHPSELPRFGSGFLRGSSSGNHLPTGAIFRGMNRGYRGMDRARHKIKNRMPSIFGNHHDAHSNPLHSLLFSGTDEEIQGRYMALVKIQKAVKRFLERKRKHRKIRCLMGHTLQRDIPFEMPRSPRGQLQSALEPEMLTNYQVCERCNTMIRSQAHYSCKECDYYVCDDCVKQLIELDQGMGKQDQLMARTSQYRPGIRIYWLKYLLGLGLLIYFLLANSAIFKSEARSALESVQANNISAQTLTMLTVHLMLLIFDRIFHKWHYRNSSTTASLKVIDALNVLCLLGEFFWVHVFIIIELKNAANPRDQKIALHSEVPLCIYYIGWMLYLGVCLTQRKYGLPAVDHDTLRPTAPPDSMGIYIEKIHTFSWYAHYALPFVDDLRVIIDWSVMPTSLDLWMHFKVEDAHSWLFRTRHAMYVRRQSFFAEQRDACEKVYSGWLIVLLLVFIILMPLLVFSPITPFPNSVPIEDATLELSFGVATACEGGPLHSICRSEKIQLYKALASQILEYNSSRKTAYLEDNPRAPTDIDIQEVLYPKHSRAALEVSPPVGMEVEALLAVHSQSNLPVLAYFETALALTRANNMPSFGTRHFVCFCVPAGSCPSATWPPAVVKACNGLIQENNTRMQDLRTWWQALGRGVSYPVSPLVGLWEASVRVGTGKPLLLKKELPVSLGLENCSIACSTSWCSRVHCFASMEPVGRSQSTVIYELERSAMLNPLGTAESTSFSVVGLYIAVVLVAGRYLRVAFQGSSKRSIYEEIPDVSAFLDLVTAIKLAREHRDLRTEFQLYYCLMKVLRSTNLLLTTGGHEPSKYGVGRSDEQPPECEEPRLVDWRMGNAAVRSGSLSGDSSDPIVENNARTFAL